MKARPKREGQASDYTGNGSVPGTRARVSRSSESRQRVNSVSPSAMSPKERMAELGGIFAEGFHRSLNCLDDLGDNEACG